VTGVVLVLLAFAGLTLAFWKHRKLYCFRESFSAQFRAQLRENTVKVEREKVNKRVEELLRSSESRASQAPSLQSLRSLESDIEQLETRAEVSHTLTRIKIVAGLWQVVSQVREHAR